MLISALIGIFCIFNELIIRIIPYPPNFKSTAAKIIDPAIGASTCAFGSHKWVINIGSFTNMPAININHQIWWFIHIGAISVKVDRLLDAEEI